MERRAGESVKSCDWSDGGSELQLNESTWERVWSTWQGVMWPPANPVHCESGTGWTGGAGEGGRGVGRS